MPKHMTSWGRLLFCLCCTACGQARVQATHLPPQPQTPQTSHTQHAALESGRATPLDALTPYGRREALRSLRWRGDVLVGFGYAQFVRELDHDQLAAALRFLDLSEYAPSLDKKLTGPPLRLPPPSAPLEADLQALRRCADEDQARRLAATGPATEVGAPAVLRCYRALFGARAQALAGRSPGDLLVLFDAAAMAANGNPASAAFDDLLRVHGEMTRRGIDTRRTLDDGILHAMLAARRFDAARAFAAARPHLAATIPTVVDPLGPTFGGRAAYDYDAAHDTLRRLPMPPSPSGMELVMVVGAGCHFSAEALRAIHADATLQARLRGAHLVLATPPGAPIETGWMAEWNAANPGLPMRAPDGGRAWDAIAVAGVPSFYLLKNGGVIDHHTGWDAEGKEALAGFVDAATEKE